MGALTACAGTVAIPVVEQTSTITLSSRSFIGWDQHIPEIGRRPCRSTGNSEEPPCLGQGVGGSRYSRRVRPDGSGPRVDTGRRGRSRGARGLLNHGAWKDLLHLKFQQCRQHNSQATLALIDIDHFKDINDSFGHIVGDAVLRQLSHDLKRLLDQYELAGRYGGDEFCVILPTLPLNKSEALMEQLREALQQYRHPQVPDLRVGLSIGLARYQPLYKDALDWLDDADKALYTAKHTGRNTISTALSHAVADNASA